MNDPLEPMTYIERVQWNECWETMRKEISNIIDSLYLSAYSDESVHEKLARIDATRRLFGSVPSATRRIHDLLEKYRKTFEKCYPTEFEMRRFCSEKAALVDQFHKAYMTLTECLEAEE
jgi:hypothetical protein